MTDPYYQDDLVTLWHGDCREVTDWLTADVLITDPPYGIGGDLSKSQRHGQVHGRQDWDSDLQARDTALKMWGARPYAVFGSPRRLASAPTYDEVPLIWDKGDVVAMGATCHPWRPTYELIYVRGPGWTGHRGPSVIRISHHTHEARRLGHPTPKPVGLMRHLAEKAPKGVIADPFAGSGSTLLAAAQIGQRAVGVELSEQYAEIAARRLASRQGDLLTTLTPAALETA